MKKKRKKKRNKYLRKSGTKKLPLSCLVTVTTTTLLRLSLPPLKTFFSFNACFHAAVRNRVARSQRNTKTQWTVATWRFRAGIQVRRTGDARRGGGKYAKLVEVGRKSFVEKIVGSRGNITRGCDGGLPSSSRENKFLVRLWYMNLEYLQIVFRCLHECSLEAE